MVLGMGCASTRGKCESTPVEQIPRAGAAGAAPSNSTDDTRNTLPNAQDAANSQPIPRSPVASPGTHEPRLFVLKISLGDKQEPLQVRMGDDPRTLAAEFCCAHRLDTHREAELSLKIDANMRAVLAARRYISSSSAQGADSSSASHSQENGSSTEDAPRTRSTYSHRTQRSPPRVLKRCASDPTSPLFRLRANQTSLPNANAMASEMRDRSALNSESLRLQSNNPSDNLPLGSPQPRAAHINSSDSLPNDPAAAIVFRRHPLSRFGQSRLRRFHSSHSLSISNHSGSGSGSGNAEHSMSDDQVFVNLATPNSQATIIENNERTENQNCQNIPKQSQAADAVDDKQRSGQHHAKIFTFEQTQELEQETHPKAHVEQSRVYDDTNSELAFAQKHLTITPTAKHAAPPLAHGRGRNVTFGDDGICTDRDASSINSERKHERNGRSRKLIRSNSAKPALRRPKSARPMVAGIRSMAGGSASSVSTLRGRTKERRRTGSVFLRLHSDHEQWQNKVLSKQRQRMKEEVKAIEHGKIPMSRGSQHLVRRPTNSKLRRSTDKLYREGVHRQQLRARQVPSNDKEEQELAEATFAPKISAKAKRMFGERRLSLSPKGSRRSSLRSPKHGGRMYAPAAPPAGKTVGDQCWEQLVAAHQRRFDMRTQAMREELERTQMKECTFKPRVTAQSRRIVEAKGVGRDPRTRLHHDATYNGGYPIDDAMSPECSFQPKISTMSKLLAARKNSRGHRSQSRHSSWAVRRQCSGPLRADASLSPKNRRRQKVMFRSASTMDHVDKSVCHGEGLAPQLTRHSSEQVLSSGQNRASRRLETRDDDDTRVPTSRKISRSTPGTMVRKINGGFGAIHHFAERDVQNAPPCELLSSTYSANQVLVPRSPTPFRTDSVASRHPDASATGIHNGKSQLTNYSLRTANSLVDGINCQDMPPPELPSSANSVNHAPILRSPTPHRIDKVPSRHRGISASDSDCHHMPPRELPSSANSANQVPLPRSSTPHRIDEVPPRHRGIYASDSAQCCSLNGHNGSSHLADDSSHLAAHSVGGVQRFLGGNRSKTPSKGPNENSSRDENIFGGVQPIHGGGKPQAKTSSNRKRKPSQRAVERQLKKKFEEIFRDLAHAAEKLPRRGFLENGEPSPRVRTPQSGCLTVTQLMSAAQHTLGCDWLLVQDMVLQQQLLKFEEIDRAMFSNLMLKYLRDVSKDNGGIAGLLGDGMTTTGSSPAIASIDSNTKRAPRPTHESVRVDPQPPANPSNVAQTKGHSSYSNCNENRSQNTAHSSALPQAQALLSPRTSARKPLVPHPPPPRAPSLAAGDQDRAAHVAALPPKRRSFRARRNKNKSVVLQDFQPHASVVTQCTHASSSLEFHNEFPAQSVNTMQPLPLVHALPRHQLSSPSLHASKQSHPRDYRVSAAHSDLTETPAFTFEAGAQHDTSVSLTRDFSPESTSEETPSGRKEMRAHVSNSVAVSRCGVASGSRSGRGDSRHRPGSSRHRPGSSRRPKSARRVSDTRSNALFDRLSKPHFPPRDHYDTECTFRPNIVESQRRCPAV